MSLDLFIPTVYLKPTQMLYSIPPLLPTMRIRNQSPAGTVSIRYYINNCTDVLPSQAGFARSIDVSERTIVRWKKKNEEFCQALEELHTSQENVLIQKGLRGEYNPTICKLILCSNHGYKERSDVSTKDDKITPQIINYADVVKKTP